VATRQSYAGDLDVTAYFSAKMLKLGGKMAEKLTDVHFGCCANASSADSGYHFVVGGNDNKQTVLLREGAEVASSGFRLPQALIHNDWLRLTIKRRGPEISLWMWDSPLITWTDPQPLPAGRIALGTFKNGVVVPRVSIYGHQVPEGPAPVLATAPARPAPARPPGPKPLPLLMFAQEQDTVEFGGDWGLWPQQEGCQGTATFVAGQDAEGQAGGAMKIDFTIKAAPQSFSLWSTSGTKPVDLSVYDRLVLYARGDVPSLTLVIKDTSATDPNAPTGIAECLVKGLSAEWKRFEVPLSCVRPRKPGEKINWRAINHLGIAMIAPQNAASGTFWIDNLRAEAGQQP
jgi:hypothetical protein